MLGSETIAYQRVCAARAKGRPTALDYIQNIFEDFFELHGDRRFGDDKAIVAGLARLQGQPITVIGIEKGQSTKEKIRRNFGSPHPEGYRKALRQMRQAEKFGRPVVCLVDTSGAFCGLGAEERGQGQAIAENLMTMMTLKIPILSIIIGEGGSGGALALAVADQVWMLENAVYSVISPEGGASILWKDRSKAAQASEYLKLTAQDLLKMGIIERIFPEPAKGNFQSVYNHLQNALIRTLAEQQKLPVAQLLEQRYDRFRRLGTESGDDFL